MFWQRIIFLLYYVNLNFAKVILYENRNNICRLDNGFIGTCLTIENCYPVRRQISRGNKVITICHLQDFQLFVCCPSQSEKIVTPDQQSTYPNSLAPPITIPQTAAVPLSTLPTPVGTPAVPVTQASSTTTETITAAAATTTTTEIPSPSVATMCIPIETTTPLPSSIPTAITRAPAPTTTSSSPPDEEEPSAPTESLSESDNLEPVTEASSPPVTDASPEDVKEEVENINPDMRIIDEHQSSNNGNPNGNKIMTTDDVEVIHRDGQQLFQSKCDEYYMTKAGKLQVLIIGGVNSSPKEFPHMAALGFGEESDKKWLCGGSLVSENYVLTAAHCVSSNTVGDVKFVRLGTTNLQNLSDTVQDFNVIRRIQHPDFNGVDQYNDIGLLQLDRPAQFSEYVLPICLHALNDLDHHTLIASGWGKTDLYGGGSSDLMKVGLELFSNEECKESYKSVSQRSLPTGIEESTQVCAGSKKEKKDTCQGDSGGPLQFRSKSRLFLVGITSFGIGCGTPGSPGVYTKVSHYISWIEQTIWNQK